MQAISISFHYNALSITNIVEVSLSYGSAATDASLDVGNLSSGQYT